MHIDNKQKEPIIVSSQDQKAKKSFFTKKSSVIFWVIIIIIILFIFHTLYYENLFSNVFYFVMTLSLFSLLLYISLMVYKMIKLNRGDVLLEHWFRQKNLSYKIKNNLDEIKFRFLENPRKKFFKAPSLVSQWGSMYTGPYAEGIINDRKIWIYKITVLSIFSKNLLARTKKETFYAWCVEIQTNHIPIDLLVTRKYLLERDVMDTESKAFEKLYNIDAKREGAVLQLLDPAMIELIMHSKIAAMEFSDSSVVLYNAHVWPMLDTLDILLENGLKIAKQADRNFPLGKFDT